MGQMHQPQAQTIPKFGFYDFTNQMHKFDTVCISNHIKIDMQAYLAKLMENLWQLLEYHISGRGVLTESGAYLNTSSQRKGPVGEGGLIELL